MLLIILTAAVVAAGIILIVLADVKFCDTDTFCFMIATAGIILAVEIIIAIIQNVGAAGKIAANEQRYESLVYQLENNLYDNYNDIGKKELYNQIQNWNEDLATGKAMQHDIWIGVFWADIYDHFEFIELEAHP